MSEASLSRRVVHSMLLTGVMVSLASCCCPNRPAPVTGPYGVCGTGVRNLNAPVVCVDVQNGQANPDPVEAYDRDSRDTTKPVQILWASSDGRSNLRIEAAPGCVQNMFCNDRGVCRASTVDVSREVRCKYTVTVGKVVVDPIVIVVPCCGRADDTETPP